MNKQSYEPPLQWYLTTLLLIVFKYLSEFVFLKLFWSFAFRAVLYSHTPIPRYYTLYWMLFVCIVLKHTCSHSYKNNQVLYLNLFYRYYENTCTCKKFCFCMYFLVWVFRSSVKMKGPLSVFVISVFFVTAKGRINWFIIPLSII